MLEINDIKDMAQHILATINRVYAEEGVSLPERQYFVIGGMGQTVHDCEQVTVSWSQTYSGMPGDEATQMAQCNGMHTGSFIVEVVRKISVINNNEVNEQTTTTPNIPARYGSLNASSTVPEPETMMKEAELQMQDAVLLLKSGLIAGEGSTTNRSIVDVSAGTPLGGYQAVIMNYTSALGLDPY